MMDTGNSRLTGREIEIAMWILLGFTSKEVARILSISSRTVEAHVNSARVKVGAKSRIHMATHLILRDLVSLTVEDLEEFDRTGFEIS